MHFAHEEREPLVDPLADGAGARVCARHDPDHWICGDDLEYVEHSDPNVAAGLFVRIYRREMRFLWRVFHDQRHADRNDKRDAGGNPKQPTPMQWRNPDQAKKDEAPEQGRAEIIDTESAQVNHKSKDPSKSAALVMTEPCRVDFHHSRRAERLEVAVDSTNHYKEPKQ